MNIKYGEMKMIFVKFTTTTGIEVNLPLGSFSLVCKRPKKTPTYETDGYFNVTLVKTEGIYKVSEKTYNSLCNFLFHSNVYDSSESDVTLIEIPVEKDA